MNSQVSFKVDNSGQNRNAGDGEFYNSCNSPTHALTIFYWLQFDAFGSLWKGEYFFCYIRLPACLSHTVSISPLQNVTFFFLLESINWPYFSICRKILWANLHEVIICISPTLLVKNEI